MQPQQALRCSGAWKYFTLCSTPHKIWLLVDCMHHPELYSLHACRLKCFLFAISKPIEVRLVFLMNTSDVMWWNEPWRFVTHLVTVNDSSYIVGKFSKFFQIQWNALLLCWPYGRIFEHVEIITAVRWLYWRFVMTAIQYWRMMEQLVVW